MITSSYSYANDVGFFLRTPLFQLTANLAISLSPTPKTPLITVISKIFFHTVLATLLAAPAGILWLIGKTICCLSNSQIDSQGLPLAPPPIEIPQDSNDVTIDIHDIHTQYVSLKIPEKVQPGKMSKADFLKRLCDWIEEENRNIFPDNINLREEFCQETRLYLKDILKKIQSGVINEDKKKEILVRLAEASTACPETWLESGATLYAEVNNQPETAQVKLLRLIQGYKEDLILEFAQQDAGAEWHALNFIRNILGNELGLNTFLNRFDSQVTGDDPVFGKVLSKWLFLQRYENTNRLIEAIRTKINLKYDSDYYDYLVSLVPKEQGDANSFVSENFYPNNELNYEGISLMLRSIGVLK